ncbi:hypothetical protein A3K93_01425 [Acinetobacter sp. NCu2D-2]|uniref:FimV/HubP-related protein n=1 Tax=Acinetobacter sp. NCu2D-2 TaxID=1608473 RepID=UPI0007CDFC94|nr:hypothetical protein [Acinetobacter sp. NCu2D-2]ANF80977.1 hypothetical protein A3K93_01425 [Acinetobacter sp. NCu2D-2]
MTAYNKLKIAILATIATQTSFAINVDPVQIQSAPGELLYAEINFRQSNSQIPVEVSLASPDDLASIGAMHQPPGHLNFYTRRNGNGTGVITITSSRPMTDRELNIIIKIKEGNAAHLQHIRKPLQAKKETTQLTASQNERPLKPIVVVSEKDIGLNLPVSTQYSAPKPVVALEKPLAVKKIAPPMLSASSIPKQVTPAISTAIPTATQTATTPSPTQSTPKAVTVPRPQPIVATTVSKPVPTVVPTPVEKIPTQTEAKIKADIEKQITNSVPPVKMQDKQHTATPPTPSVEKITTQTEKPQTTKIADVKEPAIESVQAIEKPTPIPSQATVPASPVHNFAPQTESLDPLVRKYKEQQAQLTQQKTIQPSPIQKIEHSPVQASTASANYVVQSNESLWKIAERVAQAEKKSVNEVMQSIKKNNEHAFIGGDANRLRKGASLNLTASTTNNKAQKITPSELKTQKATTPTKTKYRLNQAEMSLVAENQSHSKTLSANHNTLQDQSKNKLSLKIMTAREKTVKLQRNVTESELALNQKDHRIQLLNARLARLEQQLKAQQADKKPIQ